MIYTYNELLGSINQRLSTLDILKEPKRLYAPIEYTLSLGGKRLRPVLCLLGCNLFSNEVKMAIEPAIGLEIFHNFTLLHDDIMDKADIRRGKPTVYRKWNESIAILSGDEMHNLSVCQMLKVPAKHMKKVLGLFTKMVSDVCEGQQYDMDFEDMEEVKMEKYLKMIYLKTSSLITTSLLIGSVIGEASKEQLLTIQTFGENLGQAFQLRDDFLDVYGDPSTFGKNIGGDILCNKKTYLLIRALELSSMQEKERLSTFLNDTKQSKEEKIRNVTNFFTHIGVKEDCTLAIERYTQKALSALNNLAGIEENRKAELKNLAQQMLVRSN